MQPVDWLVRRGDRLSVLLDHRVAVVLFRIVFTGLLYVIVSSVVLDSFMTLWGFRDAIRVFAPSFPILFLLACDTLLRPGR